MIDVTAITEKAQQLAKYRRKNHLTDELYGDSPQVQDVRAREQEILALLPDIWSLEYLGDEYIIQLFRDEEVDAAALAKKYGYSLIEQGGKWGYDLRYDDGDECEVREFSCAPLRYIARYLNGIDKRVKSAAKRTQFSYRVESDQWPNPYPIQTIVFAGRLHSADLARFFAGREPSFLPQALPFFPQDHHPDKWHVVGLVEPTKEPVTVSFTAEQLLDAIREADRPDYDSEDEE